MQFIWNTIPDDKKKQIEDIKNIISKSKPFQVLKKIELNFSSENKSC